MAFHQPYPPQQHQPSYPYNNPAYSPHPVAFNQPHHVPDGHHASHQQYGLPNQAHASQTAPLTVRAILTPQPRKRRTAGRSE
ncbi:MAG: hypothetical protein L6R39_000803 [Caloplaca ligustica]|nr:MAG: hypothetical protein L6R39_000803 [Caloplaca ligustica]